MTRIRRWTVLAGATLTALFVGGPAAFAYVPVPDPGLPATTSVHPHITTPTTGTGDWVAWAVAAVATAVAVLAVTLVLRTVNRRHRLVLAGAGG